MKRLIDLTLAWLGLLVLWPLCILLATAIKLETPGPVIFAQERLGKHQRPFRCLKFRTMHHNAGGDAWTSADDPRVTRVGRMTRAVHFDEFPQLVNVIRGEMSIVGPRPLVECEAALFGALEPPHNARFSIRPGITGLAQVTVAPEAHRAKFRLDVFYVERRSMRLDVVIMFRTVRKIFRPRYVTRTEPDTGSVAHDQPVR